MKYFKILFFVVSVFSFSIVAHADNTFSFSTDPQSIGVSELSGPITIHSDTDVTETTYILLNSNSSTGQFFSSKTSIDPIASGSYIYISTNNSNRTFYYKDNTAGDFVITANIFNKAKMSQIGTASQNINIGQSAQDGNSTSTTTDTSTQSQTSTVGLSSGGNTSAHSSPSPLSEGDEKISFEVSAGRDRLTSVGSSIAFKAIPTRTQSTSGNVVYTWSFGDGTSVQGNNLTHAYKFAGEYQVVVNASSQETEAVDRILVKVIEPKVTFVKVSGGIEIGNSSVAEINLEGWTLSNQTKKFTFPKDTLLPNNKKIIFSDDVIGINSGNIEIENPLGKKYAEIIDVPLVQILSVVVSSSTDDIVLGIKKVQDEITLINSTTSEISDSNKNVAFVEPNQTEINSDVNTVLNDTFSNNNIDAEKASIDSNNGTSSQTANAITVFEAPKSRGFISTVFAWPIAGFNFIRGLFVEK